MSKSHSEPEGPGQPAAEFATNTPTVMRVIDLREVQASGAALRDLMPRAALDVTEAARQVEPILADVRERGAAAILEHCRTFDGVIPPHLRVSPLEIAQARSELAPEIEAALTEMIHRVRLVHQDQMPRSAATELADGAVVRQTWRPARRVGLYVPGGKAVYPSSVVMNVVPAQVAGVREIAVASPPQAAIGGRVHPTILAACSLLGVTEVYAVGGAAAIAMFAYGARDDGDAALCEPVDIVTGPGNVWVAAAKRLVRGRVGIDAEAGPTEIAILADSSAAPARVAYDLISQAEHDELAASVLITPAASLARDVLAQLPELIAATKHSERVAQALAGPQSAIVLVRDTAQGIDVANAYGAEHLEIQTASPGAVAAQIDNAGAIFLGAHSPVPLGDYLAGSNHVLPTGGSARFASGLGVHAFLRSVQEIEYDAGALAAVAPHIVALARAEDLPAHGEGVVARTRTTS